MLFKNVISKFVTASISNSKNYHQAVRFFSASKVTDHASYLEQEYARISQNILHAQMKLDGHDVPYIPLNVVGNYKPHPVLAFIMAEEEKLKDISKQLNDLKGNRIEREVARIK